jgi:hypothetical protein
MAALPQYLSNCCNFSHGTSSSIDVMLNKSAKRGLATSCSGQVARLAANGPINSLASWDLLHYGNYALFLVSPSLSDRQVGFQRYHSEEVKITYLGGEFNEPEGGIVTNQSSEA